jgi:hypothetical protein
MCAGPGFEIAPAGATDGGHPAGNLRNESEIPVEESVDCRCVARLRHRGQVIQKVNDPRTMRMSLPSSNHQRVIDPESAEEYQRYVLVNDNRWRGAGAVDHPASCVGYGIPRVDGCGARTVLDKEFDLTRRQFDENPTPAIEQDTWGVLAFHEKRRSLCHNPLHAGHRFTALQEFDQVGHIEKSAVSFVRLPGTQHHAPEPTGIHDGCTP